MSDQTIRRSSYRPVPGCDCVNDGQAIEEDFNRYHEPLARLSHRTLRGAGVATGLEVEGAIGQPDLTVRPGAALDCEGRWVVLVEKGTAGIAFGDGPIEFAPYDGKVTVLTAGHPGANVLTLAFHEVLVSEDLDVAPCMSREQRPVLRVRTASEVPVAEIVLAAFQADDVGKLVSVSAGARQPAGLRTGSMELRAVNKVGGQVSDRVAGTIRPREAEGLSLVADTLAMQTANGAETFVVDANHIALNAPKVGVGTSQPGFQLDVANRMRLREGNSGSAGIWFFEGGEDRAFVGMASNTEIGFYSQELNHWGLLMDLEGGSVHMSHAYIDLGLVVAGSIWFGTQQESLMSDVGSGLTVSNPHKITVDSPYVRLGKDGPDVPGAAQNRIQLDVLERVRVRQGNSYSAGIWFFQSAPNADQAFVGMRYDNQVGFWGTGLGDYGLVMDTNLGHVGVGTTEPAYRLDVADRMRVRAGNYGSAGIWFYQGWPAQDQAFIGMAYDNQVGFWGTGLGAFGLVMDTNSGYVGVGTTEPASRLDVADRMRVREGNSGSAGIWFYQRGPAQDRAFVGMASDSQVGFYGTGCGWGLTLNTSNGDVSIPRTLTVGRVLAPYNRPLLLSPGRPNNDVWIEGNLRIHGAKTFQIDHPLDPANRYLTHSVVESPEMLNIYSGTLTTGADGEAIVTLPDYFEALNRDFRYQLTVIGQFAQAIVAREIEGNHFTVRTDKPNVRVSWLVTGIRQDVYANAHPIIVEQDKPQHERGLYLNPKLYGQPESCSVFHGHQ